jgi:hypothetical protein
MTLPQTACAKIPDRDLSVKAALTFRDQSTVFSNSFSRTSFIIREIVLRLTLFSSAI